jgi:ELWxxDGT repeat protein
MKRLLEAGLLCGVFLLSLFAGAMAQTPELVKGGIDVSNRMVVAGNTLFFSAWGSGTGIELWKSDGSTDGTVLVKDIRIGTAQTYFQQFVALGDLLIFSADNSTYGYEFWKSDGTEAGTGLIADLFSGTSNGLHNVGNTMAVYNGRVYAKASNGTTGYEPWSTDGTNMTILKDINAGSGWSLPNSPLYTVSNGQLFMVASNGTSGEELFKTDGAEAHTDIVKDITPGSGSGYGPSYLVDMGGILYFTADDSAGHTNRELWRSDGTSGGTYRVLDINPSGAGVDTSTWDPELTVVNGKLFFVADNGTAGQELWASDGTPEGTSMVKDIYPGTLGSEPHGLYAGDTNLFFGADDGSGSGDELWVSDVTADGTYMVKEINPNSTGGYWGHNGAIFYNGIFYFQANDGTTGTELWRSDGTETGTYRVADFNTGSGDSNPHNFVEMNGTLYFGANASSVGGLWKIDTSGVATTTTSITTATTTVPGGTSTTTSIAGGTSTTTTTTGGGKPCPAKQVLGADNPNLENLRAFRDSRLAGTAVGRMAVQIYYRIADSINTALEHSPALRAVARSVLNTIAPKVGGE